MTLQPAWLSSPPLQKLFQLFAEAGFELFAVGGCVRNALMGRAAADIDMATNARPEDMLRLLEEAGLRGIPTGIEHGTITAIVEDHPFEITTYRHDVETDGRRARVQFSDRLEDDAARRDFTINAIYLDQSGKLIDPVGGVADIKEHRIRFIGDPDERITEDYLRILRFFRFFAWYGQDGIDADGLAACAKHADGIDGLSRERIGAEMIKLLSAPDPAPAVAAMAQSGILYRVLPGAEVSTLPILMHLEEGRAPDWIVRTVALGGEDDLPTRWRLSKADATVLRQMQDAVAGAKGLAEIAYRSGERVAWGACLIRAAQAQQPVPADANAQIVTGLNANFPVRAADLMPKLQGPALGEELDRLEARWIASGFTLTRDGLLSA